MRVVQMVPFLNLGDAVGNDILTLRDLLITAGYDTAIYAEQTDPRVEDKHDITLIDFLPILNEDDVIIYHLSTKSTLHDIIPMMKCRKIAIYHNVTPGAFFKEYSPFISSVCDHGVEEVKQLREVFDYCLAVSDFNRRDLLSYGYDCPIDIRPILVPFEDYKKTPSQDIIDRYNDCKTNILFIGRVVPNKRFEDVIAAFSCYKKFYDSDARLFLVGNSDGMDLYKNRLDEYVNRLGVKDVKFTGKIPFDEILAYYKVADVFLCMSEHEGFCVPLVEAMFFDVPIVAYASSAIPETLSGAGILLKEKDPLITAGFIDKLVTDEKLRNSVIKGQRKRLIDFSYEKISEIFLNYIERFVGKRK